MLVSHETQGSVLLPLHLQQVRERPGMARALWIKESAAESGHHLPSKKNPPGVTSTEGKLSGVVV